MIADARRNRFDPDAEHPETSMSSAPVETLSMRQRPGHRAFPSSLRETAGGCTCLSRLGECLYPPRAQAAVPLDLVGFLLVLGLVTALLGWGEHLHACMHASL